MLTIDENTGVTDVVMDPRDPDTLVAASYQRRRHVFTLIDGGPGSAVHKTTDGGKTWKKITSGLPKEEMGRIGLAIAPTEPDTVYALVETAAANKAGGTFRSTNRGESWEKRGDYVPGGPMYYQEIFVDPKDPERLYSMDVFLKVSDDAGKTWRNLGERYKHVDNHAIWIDPARHRPLPRRLRRRPLPELRPGGHVAVDPRTCPSPSSTAWTWTTRRPSTTSTAARRTTTRSAGPRAPSTPTASRTTTGS